MVIGILGNKTNHSLRAYSATKLYNAGVPEKVIQDRTGHRSLEDATLNGCTINVFQDPQTVHNISKTECTVKFSVFIHTSSDLSRWPDSTSSCCDLFLW